MFHFAGGNSYSFKFMESNLKDFNVEVIELPGRGMRSNEILIKDFDKAAVDAYNQVRNKLVSENFVLYGHSMGAYLAFKVTKMLEEDCIAPRHLIVTGNPGPRVKESELRYLLNDKDFIIEIRKLGGLPEEFLESQELLDYFIPILKADFQISEENNLDTNLIINTPIYSIMGDKEKYSKDIVNWARYTTSIFEYEILDGNHFFIYNHAERLCSIINKCYNSSSEKIY